MKIDTASHLTDQQPTTLALPGDECKVIQIEPEDSIEMVLMTLRLQSEPVILVLPEQSQAFSDPAHFVQAHQVCAPEKVSFVIPRNRMGALARYAHQEGFFFASSLEKAAQSLHSREEGSEETSGESNVVAPSVAPTRAPLLPGPDMQEDQEAQTFYGQEEEAAPTAWMTQPVSPLPQQPPLAHARKQPAKRRITLIATAAALLVIAGAVLLPALFSAQPGLMAAMNSAPATAVTTVGQIAFTSSGQLDPSSSKGLNDTITVNLHDLSTPAAGQSFYGWLMPDQGDDTTTPLLLGKLTVIQGKAQLTYVHPDHEDLLATYSGFEVAEQPSNPLPKTPPFDTQALRYEGFIPNIPTPGDEQQYSLLDHMRHLLAKDPTLQEIGLQGGLDIWLYRNSEKILEWSGAARDDSGPGAADSIHRQMIRVLEYLDGVAYVYNSGDLPSGSPLLVDPTVGRIGLLEVNQTQLLKAYLTHVDVHLQGLIDAPGHTQAQQQLAARIDQALKLDTSLFQKVRQDAVKLVRMNAAQLKSNEASSLLNDMVTKATSAYTGQFDPTTGGNIDGIVWIHNELQGIATITVTTPKASN
ncbi:MAG TPA: hypothetical protein VKX46_14830 [Ktedonobacteraceae bacterium]|nr:hypothetical protein [Ktedonobacteraceae bacterium]